MHRFISLALALIATLVAGLAAQDLTLVPPSEVKQKRQAYVQAVAAARAANANLEKDLFSCPPDEALRRIDKAEFTTVGMLTARRSYYAAVAENLEAKIAWLEEPLPDLGLEAEVRRLDRKTDTLRRASDQLEELQSTEPQGANSLLSREQVQLQRKHARELQEQVARQRKVLDAAAASTASLTESRTALADGYRGLLAAFAMQRDATYTDQPLYRHYFEGLRQIVNPEAGQGTGSKKPGKTSPLKSRP